MELYTFRQTVCKKVRDRYFIKIICCIFIAIAVPLAIAKAQNQPTFYKDIQPVIYSNCSSCHRDGQAAPFPLITYSDVVKHAKTIAMVTQSRYMPPWKADTAYRKFVDQRVLTEAEINSIKNWVEHGETPGDIKDAVAMPHFDKQSNIGKPNLVLRMEKPFKLPCCS